MSLIGFTGYNYTFRDFPTILQFCSPALSAVTYALTAHGGALTSAGVMYCRSSSKLR